MSRFIAISEAVRRSLEDSGADQDLIDVVYSGVPEVSEQPGAGPTSDPRRYTVLNLSAHTQEKDHRTLIAAAEETTRAGVSVRWVLAGSGPMTGSIKRMAEAASADIEVIGHSWDVTTLLRQADLVVHTPREEGLGTCILEALAHGVPVVSTAVGGIPEIFGTDVGTLCPPGKPDEIARTVMNLLKNREKLEILKARGREIARSFSVDSMVEGTLTSYARALEQGP